MPLPGRYECGCTRAELWCTKCGAYAERPIPLLVKRRPHFQTHKRFWNEHEFGHEPPTGPETKNNCAGEGQLQFTALNVFIPFNKCLEFVVRIIKSRRITRDEHVARMDCRRLYKKLD
jgi:hypothetical protein